MLLTSEGQLTTPASANQHAQQDAARNIIHLLDNFVSVQICNAMSSQESPVTHRMKNSLLSYSLQRFIKHYVGD